MSCSMWEGTRKICREIWNSSWDRTFPEEVRVESSKKRDLKIQTHEDAWTRPETAAMSRYFSGITFSRDPKTTASIFKRRSFQRATEEHGNALGKTRRAAIDPESGRCAAWYG